MQFKYPHQSSAEAAVYFNPRSIYFTAFTSSSPDQETEQQWDDEVRRQTGHHMVTLDLVCINSFDITASLWSNGPQQLWMEGNSEPSVIQPVKMETLTFFFKDENPDISFQGLGQSD